LGEEKWGIVVFKDEHGQNLIKTKYEWEFTLKANGNAKVCLKQWELKDIKKIFQSGCEASEYQDEITFDYGDTVAWLAMYSYKIFDDQANIQIAKAWGTSLLSYKTIKTSAPKWLLSTHAYYDEVMLALKSGIAADLNQGYILQDRAITDRQANEWILNTLSILKDEALDSNTKIIIEQNIESLALERWHTNVITRKEFLDKSYKYLVMGNSIDQVSIDYKDLEDEDNIKANTFFGSWDTWKDQFWETYYRPGVKITRWEVAYLLTKSVEMNKEVFLTLR